MTLFRLPSNVRVKIDKLWRKFLWFGGNPTRKKSYCLVVWKLVCRSYNQGGLGIINLKLMNKAFYVNGFGDLITQWKKDYGNIS
jgi:hypothetical protein